MIIDLFQRLSGMTHSDSLAVNHSEDEDDDLEGWEQRTPSKLCSLREGGKVESCPSPFKSSTAQKAKQNGVKNFKKEAAVSKDCEKSTLDKKSNTHKTTKVSVSSQKSESAICKKGRPGAKITVKWY